MFCREWIFSTDTGPQSYEFRHPNTRHMQEKTLFEKIRDREIPADIVHEDDHCLAFRDISPQAPLHILVVPKKAIPRIAAASEDDARLLGSLLIAAAAVAAKHGIALARVSAEAEFLTALRAEGIITNAVEAA